jgi:hypothetical protein
MKKRRIRGNPDGMTQNVPDRPPPSMEGPGVLTGSGWKAQRCGDGSAWIEIEEFATVSVTELETPNARPGGNDVHEMECSSLAR